MDQWDAAVVIQKKYRAHNQQQRYAARRQAAKTIQKYYRSMIACREAKRLKEQKERKARLNSILQRHQRRLEAHQAQKLEIQNISANDLVQWKQKREDAALCIQNYWHISRLAKEQAARRKQPQRLSRCKAASVIQRNYLSWRQRRIDKIDQEPSTTNNQGQLQSNSRTISRENSNGKARQNSREYIDNQQNNIMNNQLDIQLKDDEQSKLLKAKYESQIQSRLEIQLKDFNKSTQLQHKMLTDYVRELELMEENSVSQTNKLHSDAENYSQKLTQAINKLNAYTSLPTGSSATFKEDLMKIGPKNKIRSVGKLPQV